MDSKPYQALARRYRPQSFDEMVGQQAVVKTLKNALAKGKIHPAYIFSGIRGVGKTTAARLFAKGLNCVNGPTFVPCNECPSCKEIGRAASMDVLEIDGATNTKAEEARDLMQAARYTPARDRYRVFIIDEVHMLSTAAFNALLKTFEEPPPHAVFLLATTEPHKIPETIHSRAQHFQFKRVPTPLVIRHLEEVCRKEDLQAERAALELVARSGEGSVRDSLTLLDRLMAYAEGPLTEDTAVEVLGVVGRERLLALAEIFADGRAEAVPAFVDSLLEKGQSIERFLADLADLCRDLIRLRVVGGKEEPANADLSLRALAERFSMEDLLRLWDLVVATQQRLKGAPDPDALLELQLVKAALLPSILPLDQILGEAIAMPARSRPAAREPARPEEPRSAPPEVNDQHQEASEGLRFKALIPFQRMDEAEARSLETKDDRSSRFRAEASRRMPLIGHTLDQAGLSLDPDGVLHISLPATSATGIALLSSRERREALEAVAREVGYPGSIVVENSGTDSEEAKAPVRSSAATKESDQAVQNVLRTLGGQVIKVSPLAPPLPNGGTHGEPE